MISTDTCSKVIEAQAFFGKKNLKFHAYMDVAGICIIHMYISAEILTKMEKQGRFKKRKGGKGKMEENRRKGKGKIFSVAIIYTPESLI